MAGKNALQRKSEPIGYIMKLFKDTTAFSEFAYDTFEEIIPGIEKNIRLLWQLILQN